MKASVISQVVLFIAVGALTVVVTMQSSRISTLESQLESDPEIVERSEGTKTTEGRASGYDRPTTPERKRIRTVDTASEQGFENLIAAAEFEDEDETVIAEKVREAVADEVEHREQQRWQKRLEKRTERARERVASFASKAGVSEDTKLRIEDLIVTEQAEISDIFQEARENYSFGEAREKVQTVRKETDETARAELDDDEYSEYTKMREEEMEQFRGRMRGPRPKENAKKPE